MVKKIRWSPKAADNFEELCAFIGKNSEFYASMFAKKINAIVTNIPLFPESGRIVPEYQDSNLREKIFQNYRIVYRNCNNFSCRKTIEYWGLFKNVQMQGAQKTEPRGVYRYTLSGAVCSATQQMSVFQQTLFNHS